MILGQPAVDDALALSGSDVKVVSAPAVGLGTRRVLNRNVTLQRPLLGRLAAAQSRRRLSSSFSSHSRRLAPHTFSDSLIKRLLGNSVKDMQQKERVALTRVELLPDMAPADGNASYLAVRDSGQPFDRTVGVACAGRSTRLALPERQVPSAAACEALCAQTRRDACNAAQFVRASDRRADGQCSLWSMCLHRTQLNRGGAAPASEVFHRVGPSWPGPPAQVTWAANASLVVTSYRQSLAWLRTLPPGLLDVVVYNKWDFGKNESMPRMDAHYVRAHLRHSLVCGRLFHPQKEQQLPSYRCPMTCTCSHAGRSSRLAYFTTLPNYGSTTKTPYGGSREPYVMLQFVIDFWENLPPVVIFSQVWWRVRALHAPCTRPARALHAPCTHPARALHAPCTRRGTATPLPPGDPLPRTGRCCAEGHLCVGRRLSAAGTNARPPRRLLAAR